MNTMMPNRMPPWMRGGPQQPPQQGMPGQMPMPMPPPQGVPMFSQPQGMPGPGGPPGGPPGPAGGPPGGPGMNQGEQLSPDFVKNILAARGLDSQQAGIERQRKMADMLRAGASSQMKPTTVGKYTAAPGALQLAASLYGNYQGSQMDEKNDTDQKTLDGKEEGISNTWFNELTRPRGKGR